MAANTFASPPTSTPIAPLPATPAPERDAAAGTPAQPTVVLEIPMEKFVALRDVFSEFSGLLDEAVQRATGEAAKQLDPLAGLGEEIDAGRQM